MFRDAAWELEPNAFAELLERPSICSALECKNRRGRTTESDNNPFVMCRACGSKAMHKLCLASGLKSFYCNDCTIALEEGDSGRDSINSQNNNNADEDDDVNVCDVSDKEDLEIVKHLTGSDHDQQDSDSQSDIKPIKPSSSRKRRILSRDLEHSDREEQLQKSEIIMPCNSKHESKLESVQRRDDIKSESQTKKITHGILTHNSETESSEDFLAVKTNRKRRYFIIPSESEGEEQQATAKQVCFDKKNTPKVEDCDEDDDDDDDPLENFYAILQKQKNTRKSQCEENNKGRNTVTDNENKDKSKSKRPSLQTKNHENKTLDISCIAKRTRKRKTMHSIESLRSNVQNCRENTENRMDISCIAAVRNRRRTVCTQSAQEYFQQRPYEMSQIYEKVHESEYESATTTTDDDESVSDTTTTSDLKDFIVDDGYEEKDRNFEISCIASRTRKRKSARALNIATILEETETEFSSSNSTSSTSKETGVALNNFRTRRKRYNQRILSTSSEESNTEHLSTKKSSLAHTKFLEKMPTRNLNNLLMPQCGTLNNQPHSNHTRKRL